MLHWRLGMRDHLWLWVLGMVLGTSHVKGRLRLAGKVDSEFAEGALLAWQAGVSSIVCHWKRCLYLASIRSICVVLKGYRCRRHVGTCMYPSVTKTPYAAKRFCFCSGETDCLYPL